MEKSTAINYFVVNVIVFSQPAKAIIESLWNLFVYSVIV
jgi:hypothetical protein